MSLGPPLEGSGSEKLRLEAPALQRQHTKSTSSMDEQSPAPLPCEKVNVLMIGTGEYTTGFVNGAPSDSDKSAGVVALTMFDLKKRGKVDKISLCGVNGSKFVGIRRHLHEVIGAKYAGLDEHIDTMQTFPGEDEVNDKAYVDAINAAQPGDAVIIFTPDDTHFDIALQAMRRKLHVLVTKPAVKTLEQHRLLHEAALANGVMCAVEVHKRWDPIYTDARDRIQQLGPFSFLNAYMSQPKHQLETFRAWAGKSSDISYYLNSHHIDFHEWCVGETSRPTSVSATASKGVALRRFGIDCEDTITLTVQWENIDGGGEWHVGEGSGGGSVKASSAVGAGAGVGAEAKAGAEEVNSIGTAIYTSSWIAPKSDVHSQQRFFYMGHSGEVNVDQAHRGYNMADDAGGYRSVNPLFMKYTPSSGEFSGQLGYGYRSFEVFLDAVAEINRCASNAQDFDGKLASIATTYRTTAILEAGRRSLDEKKTIRLLYEDPLFLCRPTSLA